MDDFSKGLDIRWSNLTNLAQKSAKKNHQNASKSRKKAGKQL